MNSQPLIYSRQTYSPTRQTKRLSPPAWLFPHGRGRGGVLPTSSVQTKQPTRAACGSESTRTGTYPRPRTTGLVADDNFCICRLQKPRQRPDTCQLSCYHHIPRQETSLLEVLSLHRGRRGHFVHRGRGGTLLRGTIVK